MTIPRRAKAKQVQPFARLHGRGGGRGGCRHRGQGERRDRSKRSSDQVDSLLNGFVMARFSHAQENGPDGCEGVVRGVQRLAGTEAEPVGEFD
jgi:hypothetical protein